MGIFDSIAHSLSQSEASTLPCNHSLPACFNEHLVRWSFVACDGPLRYVALGDPPADSCRNSFNSFSIAVKLVSL